ncbi:4'-phosphopantetheinyl transferase family protein [Actinacidiphila sp. bgisy145]|uniref:4'-phosphopantetheinyl transferase family protein n=1 Tax=Actinacidiphila sp. bgisy145 TaxID=3413792 RepID=UPI003EBCABEA
MTHRTTDPTRPYRAEQPSSATRLADDPAAPRLWLLPEHAVPRFAAETGGLRLLTADERARHARLPTEGARRRYLGARLLSRHALSAATGLPPEQWRFRPGPFGRPEPQPAADGIRFNLAHTDGLIACVVTRGGTCGVDVERAPASPEAVAHLARRFAAPEQAELAALTEAERRARFSELWVLKEAYLKALGTGLTRPLSGFTFTGPRPRPYANPQPYARRPQPYTHPYPYPSAAPDDRVTVDDPELAPGECDRWRFDLLHPGPDHVLAVAAADGRPGAPHCTDLFDLPAGL